MTVKVWQTIKVQYCRHAGAEVALEAEVLYPGEHLPDQGPRVVAHRCSRGVDCAEDTGRLIAPLQGSGLGC